MPRKPQFEVYDADADADPAYYAQIGPDWRWRLRAANGEIMAYGEGYSSKGNVKRAIEAIKRAAAVAEIVELHE